ncbi:MAG: Gfo/Idh/MocA family oxidoreductase [Planctomycetia bacterium]|nr:Gfo/Idh/MocA family oxidoreductase [Planctomycetia bacterium]
MSIEEDAVQRNQKNQRSGESPTRRDFLQTAAAAAVGGAALAGPVNLAAVAHAGGSDVLRVGLVGCGGRGTKAAGEALRADPNAKLTALADAFQDRLEGSLTALLKRDDLAGKIDVPPERRFVGFDAYQELIASGVDVVLLATPPHFRPMHLAACIEAKKHVFAEKPVAVDAPGVRSVLKTCERAQSLGLSVVSGLCLRYHAGFQELIKRIHNGAIGDVHTLLANDYRGPIWLRTREPGWSDMTWQMRNWYYFTWLCGDFNVEQHVHYLDVCAWIFGDYPEKAVGMGGRQVRTGKEFGNIYDHHSVVYTFKNGARLFSNTRQQRDCYGNMSAHAVGSRGSAEVSEGKLDIRNSGSEPWQFTKEVKSIYQVEHDELFAGIRSGTPINNGEYMAKSTLLAIMGRMATYTGKEISWEQALNSKETLAPERYDWDAAPPEPVIAVPGVTKFV